VPSPGLQLGASIGVLRSKFEKFSKNVPDRSIGANTPPGTPNYTMGFTADYTRPLAGGVLALHTSWSHRGTMQSDAQATKQLEASKVGVLDGRIAWTMPDGRTELSAYGTNLLDRRYFATGVSLADSLGLGARFYAPPRRYGIEIRRRF
jgi:outer membrane receptor protein involved in Fe transport